MIDGLDFVVRRVRLEVNELRRTERGGARCEDEKHVLAFELRFAFERRDVFEVFRDPVQQPFPERGVRDLASAKHDRDLDLASVEEKTFGHLRLDFVVVDVDLGTQLDLAQLPVALLLPRLFVFFRLLVLEPTVVADPADRRDRRRGDLDEVEPLGPGHVEGFLGRYDAQLLACVVDDTDLADSDLLVDAKRSCYDLLSRKDVKKAKTPKRSPLFEKNRIARRHPVRVWGSA